MSSIVSMKTSLWPAARMRRARWRMAPYPCPLSSLRTLQGEWASATVTLLSPYPERTGRTGSGIGGSEECSDAWCLDEASPLEQRACQREGRGRPPETQRDHPAEEEACIAFATHMWHFNAGEPVRR